MNVNVYEKQLKRGCGLFVRCSCGKENRVPPADNRVVGLLGDAKDLCGYESSRDPWMRCEKCGNIIHLIYGDEEKIAKAEAEMIFRHHQEVEAGMAEHRRLMEKREQERVRYYAAITKLYGGLPKYNTDGCLVAWSDEEKERYNIVDADLNEEDVEDAMSPSAKKR